MSLAALIRQCLQYFAALDESNAAIHCAEVRYSPITFRLAEALLTLTSPISGSPGDDVLSRVIAHVGRYEEDKGR